MNITLPVAELTAMLFNENDSLEREKYLWTRITPDHLKIGDKILITPSQAAIFRKLQDEAKAAKVPCVWEHILFLQTIVISDITINILWSRISWDRSSMKQHVCRMMMTDASDKFFEEKERIRLAAVEKAKLDKAFKDWRHHIVISIKKTIDVTFVDAELFFDTEFDKNKESGVKDMILKIEKFRGKQGELWKPMVNFLPNELELQPTFILNV